MLEVDDRHIPTGRVDDMFESWNLGRTEPRGDFVRVQPWMERFKLKEEGAQPTPPLEVARIIANGGTFREGEWRL